MNTVKTSDQLMDRKGLCGEKVLSNQIQPPVFGFRHGSAILRRKCDLEQAKKPLLAMLEEHIDCYQRYLKAQDEGGKVLFQDAEAWIFGDWDDWRFSFANVCKQLGLNPMSLRQELLQWRATRLREVLPYHH